MLILLVLDPPQPRLDQNPFAIDYILPDYTTV